MQIAVLHQAVKDHDTLDDQDVLVQVEVISSALRLLGHETEVLPCTLDLEEMLAAVRRRRPDVVFNLVESLSGEDSLIALVPAVLEAFGVPFTGNRAAALFLTTQKLLTKHRLHAAGLPTPGWLSGNGEISQPPTRATTAQQWIIKGVWDHASRDMDEKAVFFGEVPEVQRRLKQRTRRTRRQCFAEQYIDGREIYLALLGGPGGVEVLPAEEIDFSAFPPEKLRIVDYRAKWIADSFEFRHTPACFHFPEADRPLLDRLAGLARQCWDLFSLRGWARVDFRVDAAGQPWILEINANCCLSPDAGFVAALNEAQIPFEQAVQRIVDEALQTEWRGQEPEVRDQKKHLTPLFPDP
jgi:D-alanine-D-alanine ligase